MILRDVTCPSSPGRVKKTSSPQSRIYKTSVTMPAQTTFCFYNLGTQSLLAMTAFQDSQTALETWTDTRNIQEIIDRLICSALAKTSQGVVRRPITVLLEAADTSKMEKHQRQKRSFVTGLPLSGQPSYKFGFRSSVQKNGPPGEGRHEGLVPRNDALTNGFIWFSPARTLARIPTNPPPSPLRNLEGVANLQKAICVVRSDSIIGVTLSVLSLFEFKSVDDVGAGKLREMLMLHTNPHAVHGRFTLKDECERQVWNTRAAS